jgi:tripartite-type tricarboxylate transporter receptor subunit TctC
VTVVVPYSPAGGVDIVTRLVTTPMAEFLGQSIVVENKPGGGTNIGMATVARSAPNGYSLLTASNTLTTNKALYSKLSFDPATDLIPVGRIGEAPLVVVVNAKSPYKSLAELIAAAGQARRPVLWHGRRGQFGPYGECLAGAGQFKGVHIPYKGGSTAVTDLLGGRLDFMAINPLEVAGHVNSGNLRALAVLNKNGSRLLPQVPTALPGRGCASYRMVGPGSAQGNARGRDPDAERCTQQGADHACGHPDAGRYGCHAPGRNTGSVRQLHPGRNPELGDVIRAADIRAD